jgi:hypothetical protein
VKINRRKTVYGWGINDVDYSPTNTCPYYIKWASMVNRCYGEKYLKRHPTYNGCYICDE